MQSAYRSYCKILFSLVAIFFLSAAKINAQIPTDGLVAYYPFNGNANDESGNGFHGIVHGATLTTNRFGNPNCAYSFNGVDNFTDFNDILDNVFCKDTAQFTISGWARTRVMGTSSSGNLIIGKAAGGPGPYQWVIAHNDGQLRGAVLSDSNAQNYQNKYVKMGTDRWFHFVMIFDGKMSEEDKIRIYVNDTSEMYYAGRSGTLGTTTENTSLHLYVGGQNYYSEFPPQSLYNGDVDDIRIYNRVLTRAEISVLYHEGGWDTTNHAPRANAGPDQTVYADSLSGVLVTLDGSASSDIDGDTLTYTWKQANTTLAVGVKPTILLPLGNHTLTIVVADGKGGVDTDQVVISVIYTINGLVAYYPFDGNANDASGNGYNATFISATLDTNRFGANASAYSFNGISNTIQYGDILDDVFCAPVAKFSITGWAKTRTCGSYTTGGGMIMSKSAGGPGPYQWNITHQEGLINAGVFDEFAHNYLWLSNPMSVNQWFQFALVFDGSLPEMQRLKLYVNGQASNTSVYRHLGTLGTTTQNTTQNVCIGASHEFGNPQALHSFYDGTIDDIRIYNRALTNAEIRTLFHEGGWDTTNHPPIANAGIDQTVDIGNSATLDGSASYDPDGDTLTYLWKEGLTTLGTTAQIKVTLPFGVHSITLTVDDGKGGISTDTVLVTVKNFRIWDVPSDNGKNVFVKWMTSGSPIANGIVNFSVYRRDFQDWTYLVDVPVLNDTIYQIVAPTILDSTKASGMFFSVFRVIAHTQNPSIYTIIGPDSGYSVDNLPPLAPTSGWAFFNGDGTVCIQWRAVPNKYNDFKQYILYRSSQPDFITSKENCIGTVQDTTFIDMNDGSGRYYYKVTSQDYSGNESEPLLISSTTEVNAKQSNIPQAFRLLQNYPNPFNPVTTIRYELPNNTRVLIEVFTVLGQRVAVLVDKFQTAGFYEVKFGDNELTSGIYLYRITAGHFVEVKKMLLMK